MASESPKSDSESTEAEVERLAERIGRLIRSVDPEKREDLKELAFSLVREELIRGEEPRQEAGGTTPAPMNPLGAGVLFFALGAGLSFVFGPVGLALMAGGLFFMVWGAAISWFKKK